VIWLSIRYYVQRFFQKFFKKIKPKNGYFFIQPVNSVFLALPLININGKHGLIFLKEKASFSIENFFSKFYEN